MEFSKEKFKKLMVNQGLEKLANPNSENFEQLMRKQGLEGIAGKEGCVFIIRGRDEGDKDFKVLAEVETKEEMEDWYNSLGKLVIENGGEIKIDFEPSEMDKSGENKGE